MSATRRDVTISVKGVPFIVTVLMAPDGRPDQTPKRWRIRIAGTKHDIDELLACDVLSEIDRRIKGGIEILGDAADEIPFDVPTRSVDIRGGGMLKGGVNGPARTPPPEGAPRPRPTPAGGQS